MSEGEFCDEYECSEGAMVDVETIQWWMLGYSSVALVGELRHSDFFWPVRGTVPVSHIFFTETYSSRQ